MDEDWLEDDTPEAQKHLQEKWLENDQNYYYDVYC